MSNQSSLAIAKTPGVSETTLARLQNAGLGAEEQKRFHDIVIFSGVGADALLPYVEQGVSLQTIGAAAQIRKSASAAERTDIGRLIGLANSIGELSPERSVPAGYTIVRGQLVTAKEASELELEELKSLAEDVGLDPDKPLNTGPRDALPGATAPSSGQSVSEKVAARVEVSTRDASVAQTFEADSGQEKVLAALLEVADEAFPEELHPELDPVDKLNRFINGRYNGDAIAAYVAMSNDESGFQEELVGFSVDKRRDALLEYDEEDETDHDTPESLEAAAESEYASEE